MKSRRHELRDLALLAILFDSAARVQELIDLSIGDLSLNARFSVVLHGKGGKKRIVPIQSGTAKILNRYAMVYALTRPEQAVFFNRSAQRLTRVGVTYIIKKYVEKVKAQFPELIPFSVTPHIFRHSKATELLNNGVDLIYIRDLLGHSSVVTTEIYASTNPDFLRKAIIDAGSDQVNNDNYYDYGKKQDLLEFLKLMRA